MSPFDGVHMNSYCYSMATMVLSCTVSELDGDFSRKSQTFRTVVYFASPLKGSPCN